VSGEYPSLNSHGAQSSLLANQMSPQFMEEENEIFGQKDKIYKKVADLFQLLKQGEDEAQVQMLNWENFVIQQEKMEKLRTDIKTLVSQAQAKLNSFEERLRYLRAAVRFFSQTCHLVSGAFL